jgi:isopenicillin-N epimerase
MIGSLAAVPIPDGSVNLPTSPLYSDELQDRLCRKHGIEVPIVPWPSPPRRLLRISAQIYNHPGDYAALIAALHEEGIAHPVV